MGLIVRIARIFSCDNKDCPVTAGLGSGDEKVKVSPGGKLIYSREITLPAGWKATAKGLRCPSCAHKR